MEDEVQRNVERPSSEDEPAPETMIHDKEDENDQENKEGEENHQAEEEENLLDSGGSQFILNSQQLVEALALCDDLLQVGSQDANNGGGGGGLRNKQQPCFGDYAHLGGTDDFKRDLEDCQKLVLDPCNIDLDTPPEFRLSQLVNLIHPFLLFKNFLLLKAHMGFVMCVFRSLDRRRASSLGELERLTDKNRTHTRWRLWELTDFFFWLAKRCCMIFSLCA